MPTMELASGRTFDPNGKSLHWWTVSTHEPPHLYELFLPWVLFWLRDLQSDLFIKLTFWSIRRSRHEGDYDANSKSFKSPPAVQFLARVRNCPGVYGFAFEQVPFDLPVRRSAPLLKEASFKFSYDMRLSNFSFQFSLPCAARSFRLIFFIGYEST